MSTTPTLLEMLKAGVHFGHQKSRWHPKMEQYLFGARNGVHVINLEKTLKELEKSLNFVKTLTAQGKVILFVGTKKQAKDLVKAAAESCGAPYLVERWIGGLLTNFSEVKTRLKKFKGLKDQFASGEVEKYTKREQVKMKKDLDKMERYLAGLVNLDQVPDAIYIADMRTEKTALAETEKTGVKVVGVCDSNVNPEKADYLIPANDDAINSIKMMADLIAEAVSEGKAELEKNKNAAKMVAEQSQKKVAPAAHRAATIAESV